MQLFNGCKVALLILLCVSFCVGWLFMWLYISIGCVGTGEEGSLLFDNDGLDGLSGKRAF